MKVSYNACLPGAHACLLIIELLHMWSEDVELYSVGVPAAWFRCISYIMYDV